MDEDDDLGFLNPDRLKKTAQKLKERAEKIKSGEITCDIDDPDCESCSG